MGELDDDSEAEKDYSEQLDKLKMDYFRKFIQLTKEKSIDLVVVFSPEYKTPFSLDFEPVRELCDAEGIQVIDFFVEEKYQKSKYFTDHCHLNENGARLFSENMAQVIKNNNIVNK